MKDAHNGRVRGHAATLLTLQTQQVHLRTHPLLSPDELASLCGIDHILLCSVLERLEQEGYLVRLETADDEQEQA
jgi:predicted transcriptional regulator of viral defense system